MKLLLVILGIIVAVNSLPIDSYDNLTEAEYLKIGQEFLEHVKAIKAEIKNIEEATKSVVSEKLKQIPAFQKVLDQYNDQKIINADCAAEVEQQYSKDLDSITEEVLTKTLEHLLEYENFFKITVEELDFVLQALEGQLEEEAKSCVREIDDCRIVGESAEGIEELYKSIDRIKKAILERVKIEIASKDVQDTVEENLANVPKCLTQH